MHPRPWFILNIDLKLFSPLINTHFPLCVFSSWQLWYCEWQPVNLTSILEISSEGSQTNCGWISFPQHNDSCSITTSHQAKKLNSLITLHLLFFSQIMQQILRKKLTVSQLPCWHFYKTFTLHFYDQDIICGGWGEGGEVPGDNEAKPLTAVWDCVSTSVSRKPLDNL